MKTYAIIQIELDTYEPMVYGIETVFSSTNKEEVEQYLEKLKQEYTLKVEENQKYHDEFLQREMIHKDTKWTVESWSNYLQNYECYKNGYHQGPAEFFRDINLRQNIRQHKDYKIPNKIYYWKQLHLIEV